ncbi:hypothetical protein F53441_660 [Fusarium austroafricanum]|uniref:Uncharacterized protein n=1 Tax=Fusarium austroafricanum TaxID=2364996 RepID=A0A8H4KXH3_9HYPO|nr:hypothetical protein F53441_660 [Fusarium austroafricanum]
MPSNNAPKSASHRPVSGGSTRILPQQSYIDFGACVMPICSSRIFRVVPILCPLPVRKLLTKSEYLMLSDVLDSTDWVSELSDEWSLGQTIEFPDTDSKLSTHAFGYELILRVKYESEPNVIIHHFDDHDTANAAQFKNKEM